MIDLKMLNQDRPLSLSVPLRANNGDIARRKVDGSWRACMVQPEEFKEFGVSVTEPLSTRPQLNKERFDTLLGQGKAKFSQMPYEDYWKLFDPIIREVDTRTINMEYELLASLGLRRNILTWEKTEFEVILQNNPDELRNGKWANVDMTGLNYADYLRITFGTDIIKIPITYLGANVGSRDTSPELDRKTIMKTNDFILKQRNWNLLKGGGGTATFNGRFYQGLLNNDQTLEVDNTLNGDYITGVLFNNVPDVETIFKWVRQAFWDSEKYGDYALMLGSELALEMGTNIADNTTAMFTLEEFVMKQPGVSDWRQSFKIGPQDMLCILNDNNHVDILSSSDTPVMFELNTTALASNVFMYTMEAVSVPGDGVVGHYTIIWIKDLLTPVP